MLAVDPSTEMLQAGRSLGIERGIDGIRWQVGDSTTLASLPATRRVTVGDAFHYMDRDHVLADLDQIVLPGGFVAVLVSRAINTPRAWWEPILDHLRDHGQVDAWEVALRKTLTGIEPSGRFTATVQAAVIVGQCP
ncbi:hypothetical protein Pmi06nite_79450 [Planotetraspora mira]|uniref:Methyltransferase domain-containing protein n=1 Tax=Planotetraspora mira TaxID=58121 RepID=A0A8J3XFH7_9ACTN|nr:hypothetical protein Pmi06nite_79450 [Planotetraspora mira]